MKKLGCSLIIILIVLGFKQDENKRLIKSIAVNETVLVFEFVDSSTNETYTKNYGLKGKKKNSYFNYNGKKVYLEPEIKAKCKDSLIEIIAKSFKAPVVSPKDLLSAYGVFIIDVDGNVVEKGLAISSNSIDYDKRFLNIVRDLEVGFIPSKVSGEVVYSMYLYELGFYKPIFRKYAE